MIEKILKKAKAKKASIDRTSDEYLFDEARKSATFKRGYQSEALSEKNVRVIGEVDGKEVFTYNPQKEHEKFRSIHSLENIKRKKDKVWVDSKTPKKFFKEVMENKEAQRAYREEERMINLVKSIKRKMAKKHFTNKTLAKKAGLNSQDVTDFLNGNYNIQIISIYDIAHALGKKLIVKLV